MGVSLRVIEMHVTGSFLVRDARLHERKVMQVLLRLQLSSFALYTQRRI